MNLEQKTITSLEVAEMVGKDHHKILRDIRGIDFIYLTKHDIVRHPLVQRIIDAYERYEDTKDK